MMALTDYTIRNAKSPSAPYRKLSDGGGLYIEVRKSGTKTWYLAYRYEGKQKKKRYGRYPEIKLAEARRWREEQKAILRSGEDPSKLNRSTIKRADAADSFESVGREWLSKMAERWKSEHQHWVLRRLEQDPFEVFGNVPISKIEHAHILHLIERLEQRGALEIGRKVMGYTSRIFKYAIVTGQAETNPVPDVKDAMKAKPRVKHQSQLPRERLGEFYGKLQSQPGDPVTKLALRWTILTMVRTTETRFFIASEIEGRGTSKLLWRIPAKRMKAQRDHIVPLPTQAETLLEQIEELSDAENSPWMFPQKRNPAKPISENCMLYRLYDLGFKGEATVHGFRGLASTILNEQIDENGRRRFDADWIEMQLAHISANDVRSAYNAAEYIGPRREMMQWWARYLEDTESFQSLI